MTACATCGYYRYLRTLDAHLCKHPEFGSEIREEDTHKPCDEWIPREARP